METRGREHLLKLYEGVVSEYSLRGREYYLTFEAWLGAREFFKAVNLKNIIKLLFPEYDVSDLASPENEYINSFTPEQIEAARSTDPEKERAEGKIVITQEFIDNIARREFSPKIRVVSCTTEVATFDDGVTILRQRPNGVKGAYHILQPDTFKFVYAVGNTESECERRRNNPDAPSGGDGRGVGR